MSESVEQESDAEEDTLVRRSARNFEVATELEPQDGRPRYRAGNVAHFPAGTHRVVIANGRQIGVFNIKGKFYALPNICPHQTGPVCEAKILTGSLVAKAENDWKPEWVYDGEVVICPWHGLEYHVPTGQCLAYEHIKIRRYTIDIMGNDVVIRF